MGRMSTEVKGYFGGESDGNQTNVCGGRTVNTVKKRGMGEGGLATNTTMYGKSTPKKGE